VVDGLLTANRWPLGISLALAGVLAINVASALVVRFGLLA